MGEGEAQRIFVFSAAYVLFFTREKQRPAVLFDRIGKMKSTRGLK
jgi:hypothetical protein